MLVANIAMVIANYRVLKSYKDYNDPMYKWWCIPTCIWVLASICWTISLIYKII